MPISYRMARLAGERKGVCHRRRWVVVETRRRPRNTLQLLEQHQQHGNLPPENYVTELVSLYNNRAIGRQGRGRRSRSSPCRHEAVCVNSVRGKKLSCAFFNLCNFGFGNFEQDLHAFLKVLSSLSAFVVYVSFHLFISKMFPI